MSNRKAAARDTSRELAATDHAPEPFLQARLRAYRTPQGGVHLSARFDGDGGDVHAHLPPVRSQLDAVRVASALAASTLGKRLAAAFRAAAG
jgi:hypothetical protein